MLTELQKMPKQKQKQIITKQRTKKLQLPNFKGLGMGGVIAGLDP